MPLPKCVTVVWYFQCIYLVVFAVTCFVYSPLIICCGKTCVKNERHAIRKERSIFCQYVIGSNCPPVPASWARSVAKWNVLMVLHQLSLVSCLRHYSRGGHSNTDIVWGFGLKSFTVTPESRKFNPPSASHTSIVETKGGQRAAIDWDWRLLMSWGNNCRGASSIKCSLMGEVRANIECPHMNNVMYLYVTYRCIDGFGKIYFERRVSDTRISVAAFSDPRCGRTWARVVT